MRRNRSSFGFALYEVLIGLAIFALGVIAIGRAVQNCLNASVLSEDENRVRQLLANRMAEIQASPVPPDASRETSVNTGYGVVKLIEKARPEQLEEPDHTLVSGISRVTITAQWQHHGATQSRQVVFYVYRAG
jgi:type II secretion system protein I